MSDTKAAIIHLGDRLLREKGYNAFSYADISSQLSIKNAAVHYYFPSKTDLVAAIIDQHLSGFYAFKDAVNTKLPRKKITMFLDSYSAAKEQRMICIVGTMASNWGSSDETIKDKMKEFTGTVLSWLAEVLREGRDSGEFKFRDTPDTRALLIVTNMLAAVQLMRITGPKTLQTVIKAILNNLKK